MGFPHHRTLYLARFIGCNDYLISVRSTCSHAHILLRARAYLCAHVIAEDKNVNEETIIVCFV